jgi:cardiolipin synthase
VSWAAGVLTLLFAWLLLVILFTPRIDYRLSTRLRADQRDFLRVLQSTCQATIHAGNHVEVLTNGAVFYPVITESIAAARVSVNIEAYIFEPGAVADALVSVLVERAKAGVKVRLVLDSIGSARMSGTPLRRLRDAGCEVAFYQPITWYRIHRLNNRTHRELVIVDGSVAFTGGAGIADWWCAEHAGRPAWRDTMVRIEGPLVAALQGVFAENWLECGGEILTSSREWPVLEAVGTTDAMVVKSSPADRATVSRVVFQMLIEGASHGVDIGTPYFLPDRALRRVLIGAVQRGVRVRVAVAGPLTDQRLVRLASRRLYGELLEGGVHIYEYLPATSHVKAMIVDDTWAIVGTTNFDNRSFEHNDEVNVAFRCAETSARLRRDFEGDLAASDEITLEDWRQRPVLEKLLWPIGWILERQQ